MMLLWWTLGFVMAIGFGFVLGLRGTKRLIKAGMYHRGWSDAKGGRPYGEHLRTHL